MRRRFLLSNGDGDHGPYAGGGAEVGSTLAGVAKHAILHRAAVIVEVFPKEMVSRSEKFGTVPVFQRLE